MNVDVHEATPEEGCAILDEAARRWLGMSGDDFLAKWHGGEFTDADENPDLAKVAVLVPFAE